MSQTVYAGVFALYVLGLIILGYYEYQGVDDSSDYLIAGGTLRSSITGVSELFSAMSGFWLIGVTGFAYFAGTWAWIAIIGQVTGWVIMYYAIAERLKRSTSAVGEETIPAYLGRLFDSKAILLVSALSLIIFETVYVSAQISAGAKAMTPFFDISWEIAALIVGAIIVLYTVAGGFQAVAVSDFLQGILVISGTLIFVVWTIILVGGPVQVFIELASIDPILVTFNEGLEGTVLFATILFWGFIGMYYFGNPHSLIRFFAIDDSKNVRDAMVWSGVSQLIIAVTAVFIGLTARILLGGPLLDDGELAFPLLATQELPAVASGFMLAAVIGLLMSTGDSQLLISATSVSRDIYERFLGRELSDQKSKQLARAAVLILGVFATVIAAFDINLVLYLVVFAWTGLGATFGPAIFAALWWREVTSQGILVGMAVGAVTTVIANIYIGDFHPVLMAYNLWPMILSFVSIYIISKLTEPKVDHITHLDDISPDQTGVMADDD